MRIMPNKMRVTFVRHGETESSKEGRKLSEAGKVSMFALAEAYIPSRPLLLVSSALMRAEQSAAILAQIYQVEARTDVRLNEPESSVVGIPPRLEPQTWRRYVAGLRQLLIETLALPIAEVMIVGHSGTVDAMFDHLGMNGALEVAIDHAAITEFEYRHGDPEGEWLLSKHNWHPEMTT